MFRTNGVLSRRERLLRFVIEQAGFNLTHIGSRLETSGSTAASIVAAPGASHPLAESFIATRGVGVGAGRPSTPLRGTVPGKGVVGIDFGHSHVAVAISDLNSAVLARRRVRFDVDRDARGAMRQARELLGEVLAETSMDFDDIGSAVASIPCPIDSRTGVVRSPTILSSWVGMNPKAEISSRVGVNVLVFNDADMAAWGELTYGAGRGLEDFVYIKVSEGIGAGLIFDRKLMRGARGLSGEIGHTPSGQDGPLCRCGDRGCIEAVASSAAVRAKLVGTHSLKTGLDSLADLEDDVSERIFAVAGRLIGKIVVDVCNLLNPTAIILGGELGEVGGAFIGSVRETVDRRAQRAMASTVSIVSATLGRDAELMGALAKAVEIAREAEAARASPQRVA